MGIGARLGAGHVGQERENCFGSDTGWDGDKSEGGLVKTDGERQGAGQGDLLFCAYSRMALGIPEEWGEG